MIVADSLSRCVNPMFWSGNDELTVIVVASFSFFELTLFCVDSSVPVWPSGPQQHRQQERYSSHFQPVAKKQIPTAQ